MRRILRTAAGLALAAACGMSGGAAGADEAATVAKARELAKQHADAIVWVSGTVKMTSGVKGMQMPAQERKFEAPGAVIDPAGLVVVSYTLLDVTSMMGSMSFSDGSGETMKVQFKSEFSDLKIRLTDGTEIPAKLVLKDTDLDLAFVMPDAGSEEAKKAEGKYSAIKLEASPAAGILDEVIMVSRLGKSMDRQPAVAIGRIQAVIKKPRTFYAASLAGLGVPAFTADGKVLGILLMRKAAGGDDSDMLGVISMAVNGGFTPVILPAADVAEVAQQALQKKKN
jgi:hypothetical protein